jgi:hypothetical protein
MSVRWGRYGISGKVYEAVHELTEFGVIELNDPMPTRRRGKFRPFTEEQQDIALAHRNLPGPVPYRFIYDGVTVVSKRARTSSPPPSGEIRTLPGWQPAATADHPRTRKRQSGHLRCPVGCASDLQVTKIIFATRQLRSCLSGCDGALRRAAPERDESPAPR